MSPEPINFIPIPCVDMNLSEVNRAEQTTTAGRYWYVSTYSQAFFDLWPLELRLFIVNIRFSGSSDDRKKRTL